MESIIKQFLSHFGEGGEIRSFFAPGRINLIGEHIDYNGGWVFPAALSLGITALVRRNDSPRIRMISLQAKGEVSLDIYQEISRQEGDWGNYPKGVFFFLRQQGYPLVGCDVLFDSTLPEGAGLSSSAAMEVLCSYFMLRLMNAEAWEGPALAKFCQRVENEFVKVNCGIMDQFAVTMGKGNQAILLNCQNLDYRYVPFQLEDYSLLVMNTNKPRELIHSKYNERREECETALRMVKEHEQVSNLCGVSHEQIQGWVRGEILKKRARHVASENKRVMEAVNALEKGDLLQFATLLTHSHFSLKYDYEVTGFELDTLVDEALQFEDCIGARMTGAGFGGCAIALVKRESVEAFRQRVAESYQKKTQLQPIFYESKIGNGVEERPLGVERAQSFSLK